MKSNKPATKRVANQNKKAQVNKDDRTTIMVSKETRELLGKCLVYDQTMDQLISNFCRLYLAKKPF